MPFEPFLVKEIYFTIQGEGARTGRHAVFCRFAGCNLWSGLEKDRRDAPCDICDTEFVGTDGPGGGRYPDAASLTAAIHARWPDGQQDPYVVFTGGEPLLQLTEELVEACHDYQLEVAIETNGTLMPPAGVDWICVSPKIPEQWVLKSGDELKLLYPYRIKPTGLTELPFSQFFLQPVDGPDIKRNTDLVIAYCRANPPWQTSLQTHKLMGIP
jgi:7-carboxy-7-deazaguanine synthase (Cx14CxxC type)